MAKTITAHLYSEHEQLLDAIQEEYKAVGGEKATVADIIRNALVDHVLVVASTSKLSSTQKKLRELRDKAVHMHGRY
jgi:hypothetical protein